MKELLNRLFPKDEEERRSSKFVDRGLEALRLVRDEHSVAMGNTRRVPSNFELRVSPEHFDSLRGMDALRDMEFFFKDELMKELAAARMRTFGDHTIRVGIASDPALGPNELYAIILNPERKIEPERRAERASSPPPVDATRVLDQEIEQVDEQSPTVAFALDEETDEVKEEKKEQTWGWNLVVRFPDGRVHEERLDSERWIVGRRGSTGTLPAGVRKLDLDLPTTISREQLSLDLDGETMLVKRIGKGSVGFKDGSTLAENESRRLELGEAFFVEAIEVSIVLNG